MSLIRAPASERPSDAPRAARRGRGRAGPRLPPSAAIRLARALAELTEVLAEIQGMSAGAESDRRRDSETGREYLSVHQLAAMIPYREQTIRNMMCSGELRGGVHYFRKGRRVIFRWSAVQRWIRQHASDSPVV